MKLTKSQLKSIIKEELNNLNEDVLRTGGYLNKPSDQPNDSIIKLILERNYSAKTAWYRLETDGWFRRYWNPGKGYGIMLREFKLKPVAKYKNYSVFIPFTCKYLPAQFDDMRDDVKENWEHTYGFIVMTSKVYELFELEIGFQKLESYIRNHINKGTYTP